MLHFDSIIDSDIKELYNRYNDKRNIDLDKDDDIPAETLALEELNFSQSTLNSTVSSVQPNILSLKRRFYTERNPLRLQRDGYANFANPVVQLDEPDLGVGLFVVALPDYDVRVGGRGDRGRQQVLVIGGLPRTGRRTLDTDAPVAEGARHQVVVGAGAQESDQGRKER